MPLFVPSRILHSYMPKGTVMKKTWSVLGLLMVLAATVAATLPTKQATPETLRQGVNVSLDRKTDVRLREIYVAARDEFDNSRGIPGVRLDFVLLRKDKDVLRVDSEKSKVTVCVDDLGRDLIPAGPAHKNLESPEVDGWPLGRTSPNVVHLMVSTPIRPSPGAARFTLGADVVLVCGLDRRQATVKKFPLKAGATAHAGPFAVKLTDVDTDDPSFVLMQPRHKPGDPPPKSSGKDTDVIVSFVWTNPPGKEIYSLGFFDNDGTEIPVKERAWGYNSSETKIENTSSYVLARKPDTITLLITYYDKVEEVVVPIAVYTGLGF